MNVPPALLDGYRRFRHERYLGEEARYRRLAEGQSPRTMIIGCADSRVDPATIFSAAPGELFVVRNVAALVPPYDTSGGYHGTSAAIEFAVEHLRVREIVVMGHGACGGVAAALAAAENRPVGTFIGPWVEILAGVRAELLERTVHLHEGVRQHALERMSVQLSLDNLSTFPFVQKALEENTLTLHGGWFAIATGELHWLDWDTGVFEPLEVGAPPPRLSGP
jgi:carbonic anhydrase